MAIPSENEIANECCPNGAFVDAETVANILREDRAHRKVRLRGKQSPSAPEHRAFIDGYNAAMFDAKAALKAAGVTWREGE